MVILQVTDDLVELRHHRIGLVYVFTDSVFQGLGLIWTLLELHVLKMRPHCS